MSTEFIETPRQEQKIDKLPRGIVLREPPLSLERDRFNTEVAYAFNRGISLLGIDTLRRLKEWGSDGRATARNFKTIDGETAVVYEATPKALYGFRAVIVPNSEGVASRITVEKTTGKGERRKEEYFEIKLGNSPSYREVRKYTDVNGARVTESRRYEYDDLYGEVWGAYRLTFPLNQQQRGKSPFKFGEVSISYAQKGANFLRARGMQISFADRLEPMENAFLDLRRTSVLRSAAESVRERVGKPGPEGFSKVRVLSEAGIAGQEYLTVSFGYDPNAGVFNTTARREHAYTGDYINLGDKKRGVSIPAEMKGDQDFIVRPFGAFVAEPTEQLSGSKTFVKTRLRVPHLISADSKTENYIVPRRVIGE